MVQTNTNEWRRGLRNDERRTLIEELSVELRKLSKVSEDEIFKVVRDFEKSAVEKSTSKVEYLQTFKNKIDFLSLKAQEKLIQDSLILEKENINIVLIEVLF